jgi:hypothetical protein
LQGNQFSQNDFDLRFAKIPRCFIFEFFNTIGTKQTSLGGLTMSA